MTPLVPEEKISLVGLNIVLYFDGTIKKQSDEIVTELRNNGIVAESVIATIIPIPEGVNDIPMIYLNNGNESVNISKTFFQLVINYDINQNFKEIQNIDELKVKLLNIFDYLAINRNNINRVGFVATYFMESNEGTRLVSQNFLKNQEENLVDINIRIATTSVIENRKFNNAKSYNIGSVPINGINKSGIIGVIDFNSISEDKTNIEKEKFNNIISMVFNYLDNKNIIF